MSLRVLCRRHFSPLRVHVDRAHRVVVVLNPKVASKTLRHVLALGAREVAGLEDPSAGRYRPFRKPREFPVAAIRDYLHAFRFPSEYRFFCFVRNPYARLRSAWLAKLAWGHRDGYPRSIRRGALGQVRRFARARGLPGAVDGSAIPFDTFLSCVESLRAGTRDHHWDDQHQVLLMQDIRYERCFRMEGEFGPGVRQLCRSIGMADALIEKALRVHLNAGPRGAGPVFTPDLAARVRRLHARDFDLFGYGSDSWMGL